jgi:hypothetical protein
MATLVLMLPPSADVVGRLRPPTSAPVAIKKITNNPFIYTKHQKLDVKLLKNRCGWVLYAKCPKMLYFY